MALQKTPLTVSPAPVASQGPAKPPASKAPKGPGITSTPFWVGLGVSLGWVGVVCAIVAKAGPSHSLAGVALSDWAVGVSAAISPVAMVWMVTAYLQRAADIQTVADPLRRQLTLITGESGAADARIRRFNQALREQIDLLRSAQNVGQEDVEKIIERMRQHKADLERLDGSSKQQISDIQDVIRRSMLQIEQMMDDKFTMLRVLDGKLTQNGDGVARQVETVGAQVAKMLEEVEGASLTIAESLDRASRDSQKLADTSRLQGSSLTLAAQEASETLGGLSGKIDLSVARFLERASSARGEAERLAHTLEAQTRALDEFSNNLPVRVGEAEAVLRGVADRLYASEQMAREQAVHLSEKLSQQVEGLQSFMDRFTGRLSDIDSSLSSRQNELNGMSERIGSTTTGFLNAWEKSVSDLSDQTGNALLRFTVVNDETRRTAETASSHLNETTAKYEEVVARMRAMASDGNVQMKSMTEEVMRHLSQFEQLSAASSAAGEEVQVRAGAALENLQHVLERLLTARDATQSAGQSLVKDIGDAVAQNEKMIERLGEAAQIGARTIGIATDNLGRQQNDLSAKAKASESTLLESVQKLQQNAEQASNGLREQTVGLARLLSETQGHLTATEQKLQSFAVQAVAPVQKAMYQIDSSADQGLKSLSAFGDGLSSQVNRFQDFHARIGDMSQQMSKVTAESASALETLGERFTGLRAAQEEAARQTLSQFSDVAERLQREISGLDGQASTAAELLQQAALKVGEQSYQMMEKAQNSGAQIKQVAAALQTEAAQIESTLRQQSEAVSSDLTRAEQKFLALGDTLRANAENAYGLLDRVSTQYRETAEKLDASAETVQSKAETAAARIAATTEDLYTMADRADNVLANLGANITQQAASLSVIGDTIAAQQNGFAETSDKQRTQMLDTVSKLGAALDQQREIVNGMLNRLTLAQDETASAAERAADRLGASTQKISDGIGQVDAKALAALASVQKASEVFAKEAGAIGTEAKNVEQQAQSIITSASGLHSQIYDLRVSMQHDGERTAENLTATLARIASGSGEIREAGSATEQVLTSLQRVIGAQSSELMQSMQQISERQNMLTTALEEQRATIGGLLNRFTLAQDETAAVAERAAIRLSENTLKIAESMGQIGTQARTALASVEASVSGFAEQAGVLNKQSQAAEQQVRGVMSVTSGMKEQAQHLREALQTESAHVIEQLSSVIGQLDIASRQVKAQGSETLQALDQTALRFMATTEAGIELIEKQMGAITQSEARISGADERVRNHLKLVAEFGDKTQEQASQLANTAEFATTRLAALRDTITVSEKSGQDIVAVACQRIEEVKAALQGQLQHLASFSQQAVAQVEGAVQTLASQSDTLRANLASSESALSEAADTVREEAKHVPAVIQRGTSEIEKAALALKGSAEATDKSLVGTADRFISVTSAARNAMVEEMQRVSTVADEAGKILGGFNQLLAEQVVMMQRSTTLLSGEQKDLVEKANRSVTSLADINSRLSILRSEASATAERLSHEFDALDQRATSISGHLSQAGSGLVKQVNAITEATARAETQIAGTSDTLTAQLDRIKSGLQSQIDEVGQSLTHITTQLEKTGSSLRSAAVGAVADVEHVGKRFDQTGAVAVAQVRAATEEVSNMLGGFGSKFDAMLKHMAEAGDDIKNQEGNTIGYLQNILGHLGAVAEKLETTRTMSGDISHNAIEKLDAVVTAVQAQMSNMTAGAQTAAGIMRGIGQIYGDQTTALSKGVGEAHSQVLTMNRSIDEMQQRTDQMRTSLQTQGEELMQYLQKILSQLEMSGDGLSDAVYATLQQQADKKVS